MMLELSIETQGAPEDLKALLQEVAEVCAALEGVARPELFGRIVDNVAIRAINRQTRGIDRATDVLSFPSVEYPGGTARDHARLLRREYNPSTGCVYLGDFVLSLETAKRQAIEYGHSVRRELGYLTAHAMFHLMGYDHEGPEDKRAMRAMEEQAMRALALYREDREMDEKKLFEAACDALANAYAPYSKYKVGACVLTEDGRMFSGSNIENASYGLSICAERAAVAQAISSGARKIVAVAIAGEHNAPWPCGACRQVLWEFGRDMRVVCGARGQEPEKTTLSALLPNAFGPDDL